MREQYNNGGTIGLVHNGCDGCDVSTVNGTICHELGCPDAWKDKLVDCRFCGSEFYPEYPGQECCDDECLESYWG